MRGLGSHSEISLIRHDSDQLHQAIDQYILRLERERRQGALLDHSITQLEAKLTEKKLQPQTTKSSLTRKLQLEIEALERKQQLILANTGDLRTQNRTLRRQIDNIRREQDAYRHLIAKVSDEIGENHSKTELTFMNRRKSNRLTQLQQNQVQVLRSKSANERVNYASRVQDMSEFIHKDSENKSNYMKQVQELFQEVLKRPVEHLDLSHVQAALMTTWTQKLKSKKDDLDAYIQYIKNLEEAFSQIRNATGIARISVIVTGFIKSEDQQYALCTHVNDLTSEIDTLEEGLGRCKRLISVLTGGKEQKTTETVKETLNEKLKAMEERIQSCRLSLDYIHEALDLAETPAGVLHDLVLRTGSLLNLPVPTVKSPDFNLKQLTVEVEDWLETLINAYAEMTAIQRSLEQLSPKRFDVAKVSVSAMQLQETPLPGDEETAKYPFSIVHFRQRLQHKIEAINRSKSVGQ